MAIKLASNLSRNRYGVLHFRLAIPPDLRNHFKVKEIYRSLRTASIKDAVDQAQTLSIALKRAFAAIRQQTMSNEKKTPTALSSDEGGIDVGLIFEWNGLKIQTQPHDTPDERAAALALMKNAMTISDVLAPASMSCLFSELVEDYRRDRQASEKWTSKTEGENLAVYELFKNIIGDMPIGSIEESHALTYFETLQKLPPNLNKKPAYAGKTIAEIVATGDGPMAVRTINKNIERVSSLFKWATTKPKYNIRYNPFSNRSLNDDKAAQRQPFTNDELAALFGAEEYTRREFVTEYAYWLPLMGLLTGARLGELCQLYLVDFELIGGVHCINIRDEEEGQRVKSASARRLVPIHDKLIEVGMLRFVETLRANGHDRLFPSLKPGRDGFASIPSKWFGRFKERCGIMEKQTKVFHSFRHTFISTLLDDDVPEGAIAPIVGHEGKLVTSRVYWNAKDATKRKPTVEKYQPPPAVWAMVPAFEDIKIGKVSAAKPRRAP
jgi:integrase